MKLQKKKIVILGAGESGTGAAVLAKKQGFEVFVSDKGKIKNNYKDILQKEGIEWEEKKHTEEKIFSAEQIIKSPGIPDNIELIKKLQKRKIPVISEIEFAGRYTKATKICITGSNGKTTTTMLIYHILKQAGKKVALTGNIGKSFALAVAEGGYDYYVIELSSFQLDGMYDFRPEIAILLNITPDHLDRYENNFDKYIKSKFRIIQNMKQEDIFIYCSDDKVITKELEKINTQVGLYPFSVEKKQRMTAYKDSNTLTINLENNIFKMETHEFNIEGIHNVYNSMAAGIAAMSTDIKKTELRQGFQNFQNVEHRLEKHIKVGGIQFINDSKATNVNSVWYALQTMKTDVVWIVGGIDKGNDYSILKDLVKERVKAIVTLGPYIAGIVSAFGEMVNIEKAKSMDEAVQKAYNLATDGDTVLLSPACASFDLFENYEHRGREFKNKVREL